MRQSPIAIAIVWMGVVLMSAFAVPQYLEAQESNVSPGNTTSAEDVRSQLALRLGVPVARLEDNADLIADLKLDHAVVHYAALALYKEFNVASPAKELTRTSEIVEFILDAKRTRVTRKAVKSKTASYVQTVFYATNRDRSSQSDIETYFGKGRIADRALKYGVVEVNIPFSHKRGQIETPWLKYKVFYNPNKHIYMLNLKELGEKDFYSRLTVIGQNTIDDVMVYIHGFNVTFNDAVLRAAQISFDFGFKGSTVVFSWPSDGSMSPFAYTSDWTDVMWSVKYIEKFLATLRQELPGKKIHLVAHSMGNKGVLHAMRLLAAQGHDKPLFENVVLCAPDFDAELFAEQIAPEIEPLTTNLIVYASQNDGALSISTTLTASPRLGLEPLGANAYQVINASEIEVSPWSVPETHSYYATKIRVINDMIAALKGIKPNKRGLIQKSHTGGDIWFFD